ncbi:hypothetical protein CERSUDRAFT_71301 [Gelatoporia subvermispora B]|uniref:Uncharacterized protein n=1 Tax=Ceriporiopsis subvermispora (strain B) TaxID=914234 RepID=M2PWB8_CERS8|nr:hypothetical protein CERSUDRAFT_71301 [Gelatoporia subvermispora B]
MSYPQEIYPRVHAASPIPNHENTKKSLFERLRSIIEVPKSVSSSSIQPPCTTPKTNESAYNHSEVVPEAFSPSQLTKNDRQCSGHCASHTDWVRCSSSDPYHLPDDTQDPRHNKFDQRSSETQQLEPGLGIESQATEAQNRPQTSISEAIVEDHKPSSQFVSTQDDPDQPDSNGVLFLLDTRVESSAGDLTFRAKNESLSIPHDAVDASDPAEATSLAMPGEDSEAVSAIMRPVIESDITDASDIFIASPGTLSVGHEVSKSLDLLAQSHQDTAADMITDTLDNETTLTEGILIEPPHGRDLVFALDSDVPSPLTTENLFATDFQNDSDSTDLELAIRAAASEQNTAEDVPNALPNDEIITSLLDTSHNKNTLDLPSSQSDVNAEPQRQDVDVGILSPSVCSQHLAISDGSVPQPPVSDLEQSRQQSIDNLGAWTDIGAKPASSALVCEDTTTRTQLQDRLSAESEPDTAPMLLDAMDYSCVATEPLRDTADDSSVSPSSLDGLLCDKQGDVEILSDAPPLEEPNCQHADPELASEARKEETQITDDAEEHALQSVTTGASDKFASPLAITDVSWLPPMSSPPASSPPIPSSSPDLLFSSSPPRTSDYTPPSSPPPAPCYAMDVDKPANFKESGRPEKHVLQDPMAEDTNVGGLDDERHGKRQKLDVQTPSATPQPKRPTATFHQEQKRKLKTPFRSPLLNPDAALHGVDAVYASGKARPKPVRIASPSNLSVRPTMESKTGVPKTDDLLTAVAKDYTQNAAKQFRSPLAAQGTARVAPASSGVGALPTIQALQSKVQALKQAIKINQGDGDDDDALEALASKWKTAAREVAWAVWDTVKDLDPGSNAAQTKTGWLDEEYDAPKKQADKAGGSDSGGRSGRVKYEGFDRGWGWDEDGKSDDAHDAQVRGVTDEREEEETQVPQHTLGTMLRHLGIDPETLGWDEDEGDFVDPE